MERNRLLFVGSMDYQANIDAVVWFGDRVWPELSHRLPQLLFTVVGRDPSTAVIKLAAIPRIEVTGWVADVRGFYHDALAAVVPLHFGSGTRIKILEAMAANVPVVSTSAGAEGLDVLPDVHYLAAETPEDFRLAIENLHSDSPLRKRLTMNARRLVEKRYDWKLIGSRLRSIYCGALNLHAQSTA